VSRETADDATGRGVSGMMHAAGGPHEGDRQSARARERDRGRGASPRPPPLTRMPVVTKPWF
jgi:hypothetical protein